MILCLLILWWCSWKRGFEIFVNCRALDGGRCVLECAKGKHQSGGRCHLCDHTCATCVDAGPANCTSCDTGEDYTSTLCCVWVRVCSFWVCERDRENQRWKEINNRCGQRHGTFFLSGRFHFIDYLFYHIFMVLIPNIMFISCSCCGNASFSSLSQVLSNAQVSEKEIMWNKWLNSFY